MSKIKKLCLNLLYAEKTVDSFFRTRCRIIIIILLILKEWYLTNVFLPAIVCVAATWRNQDEYYSLKSNR